MISVEVEKFIKKLLREGVTPREICIRAGVCRRTVYRVKATSGMMDRTRCRPDCGEMISIGKEKKIRELLEKGFTISHISRVLHTKRDTIRKIKKLSGLRERKSPVNIRRFRSKYSHETPRDEGKNSVCYDTFGRSTWTNSMGNSPIRCLMCGGLIVVSPCILCSLDIALQEGSEEL